MKEEELEARGVGADDLLQSPLEGLSAAYGGVRVPLDRRLVHCQHYPSWVTLHLLRSLSHSLARFQLPLSLSLSGDYVGTQAERLVYCFPVLYLICKP